MNKSDTMTKWHVDNFLSHCVALSMIVDDFESDTIELQRDLGLSPNQ